METQRSWELSTVHLSLPPGVPERAGEDLRGIFVPFSIFTATVLQVEDLSMPKADASTTFPKAP